MLRNLTLRFAAGGIYCIMGPSGCGKTTLLHILLGICAPDSGVRSCARGISFAPVFQEDRLCENLSVGGNIRLAARAALPAHTLHDALSAVGMGAVASSPVHTLSGGMKRRVALLRALLSGGGVLVFDEAFKGLDDDTRRRAMDFTRAARAG
ncbi:MAG: ATP-binding cassette domain-containing protein, partial [Clostridiales Family XIII bacterium]|nr:ATP-binding cassette domain-containing protein [Clostridiales Family XIII bacterium]